MKFLLLLYYGFTILSLAGQPTEIEGYVYDSDNRGYISEAIIHLYDSHDHIIEETLSDRDGYFNFKTRFEKKFSIVVKKRLYELNTIDIDLKEDQNKYFVKAQLKRSPGYIFEATIADKKQKNLISTDGLSDYRIDVYNNTTEAEELVLNEHPSPVFSVPFEKGNHYTVLIRKEGYKSKRIEAFVDVEECILCFEGLGSVGPGVTENLSDGNDIGVLLSNITLERAYTGQKMQVNDLYYDLGKSVLKAQAKKELNSLATMMRDNPRWIVELGSHTDSRGASDSNIKLSEARANSAVEYLVYTKNIERDRISAKGYGETQLMNECKDDVYCKESEHQKNRRTEIKIVGMSAKTRYQSLAEIKRSENMEKLLQEIQFGGQVKIPVYSDAEDAALKAKRDSIRLSLEESALEEELQESLSNKSDEIESKSTFLDQQTESVVLENKKESKEENSDKEKDFVALNDANFGINKNETKSKEGQNSIQKTKVEKDEKVSKIKTIKIVILESQEIISRDHEIFKTHTDILEIYHKGKFKYLLGQFENRKEAKTFLKSSIKPVYPDAYIVQYD